MKDNFWKALGAISGGVAVVALVIAIVAVQAPDEPIARSYNTTVYTEQGGAKLVVASGGEIEVQSGGTLDVQSGATTDYSGGVDLDGALLDLDADGDTSIQADTDDQIDVEISGADDFQFTANTFTALAGSSIVNNGALDQNNNIDLDGASDEVHLQITGFTTQTNHLVLLEQTDGTDLFWVTNNGDAEMNGATPTLTIGDAGEEDAGIVLDGAAQDFYIALDDSAEDLIIGLGSAVGTTPIISMDESQNTDIAGTLQYGANNLYPVGYASSGQQLVYGTDVVTGTLAVTHGLTTVTFCTATLGEDPETGAGDAAFVTVAVAGNACTVKVWQDDWTTAATEADVVVQWLVVGAP